MPLHRQEADLSSVFKKRSTTFAKVLSEGSGIVIYSRFHEVRLSRANIVTTLRLGIKALEEKNRELTELLEHAYGVIAQT